MCKRQLQVGEVGEYLWGDRQDGMRWLVLRDLIRHGFLNASGGLDFPLTYVESAPKSRLLSLNIASDRVSMVGVVVTDINS